MAEMGRPTIMTESTLKKLEDAFANGASDLQACFLADISSQTLYNYQKEHPDFIERKQKLKDMIAYRAKLRINEAIDGEEKPETAKWYLERKDKEFKAKSETDITSQGEKIEGFNFITNSVKQNETDHTTNDQAGSSLDETIG